MISLNDYLYSGDTVLKIIQNYANDLKEKAIETHNEVDMAHYHFLIQIEEMLEHNDFLTTQSQKIREFYKYMAAEYPYLAFTFKGRIKSLIRAEEKFNGYIVAYIYDYYISTGTFPTDAHIKKKLNFFRDLIAYRIVISMPKCHLSADADHKQTEIEYLFKIANILPGFMEERGFSAIPEDGMYASKSKLLQDNVRHYYRDYITTAKVGGYESLHITLYDNSARCYTEVQLRTKEMDDYAEIGPANHFGYQKGQEKERARRDRIPVGECLYFDEAYERGMLLQTLDLSKLNVNMFTAYDNNLINDGCGLYRGRLILPYEHLSRFQNDIVD